ncbi:MAG: hypothetical protein ABFS08_11015 [Pseudomonadota bacterium]
MQLIIKTTLYLFLLTLPVFSHASTDEGGLRWHDGEFRLGFETLELPGQERMGLLGGSYLVDMGRYSYVGLGVYGALTGERGGFFTGGVDGGLRFPLNETFSTELGVFVGGGGGGAAPQGGGLMLRPYLGLSWHLPTSIIGVQLSEVRFPNGDISSRQLGLNLSWPMQELVVPGWLEDSPSIAGTGIGAKNGRYSVVSQRYIPDTGTCNTAGAVAEEGVTLLGFEAETSLERGGFATLATAGAGSGQSDGYAEVLAGVGWRYPLSSQLAGKLQLRAGLGGGGAVDTGGGLITKLEGGLEWTPSQYSAIGLGIGRFEAPDGGFAANMASVSFGYRFAGSDRSSSQLATFSPRHWQISISSDSYLLDGSEGRKVGSSARGNVGLITAQIDSMLNRHLLLSGAAGAAYDGGAGGYAVGLVGVGWHTPLPSMESVWLRADAQLGVAGGGGLDVGGGFLWQSKLGLGWQLNKAVSLQLAWGRVNAPAGTLDSELVSVGISVRTTTLHGVPNGR